MNNNITITPTFRYKRHLYILKRLLIFANLLALSVYLLLRVIFYDLPFQLNDELLQLLNAVGTASIAAISVSLVLFVADGMLYMIRKRKHAGQPAVVRKMEYKIFPSNVSPQAV